MIKSLPPAVAFIAPSGTGKTTLIEALIREFKLRGLKVGALKHDAHKFQIDHPGKDSWRFTAAGADSMLISSGGRLAFVSQQEQKPQFNELLETYFQKMDLVLVEGYKESGLPKIAVHRHIDSSASKDPDFGKIPQLMAIATDIELQTDFPQLDLNKPQEIANFLVAQLRLKI